MGITGIKRDRDDKPRKVEVVIDGTQYSVKHETVIRCYADGSERVRQVTVTGHCGDAEIVIMPREPIFAMARNISAELLYGEATR